MTPILELIKHLGLGIVSVFLFIEVTIDPSSNTTPYILSDSLIFEIGNNIQSVKLVAWGQDAHFYTPNTYGEVINGTDTTKIYYHQINSNFMD